MSDGRDSQPDVAERIHAFWLAGACHELSDAQWDDFEQLLRENEEACRLYLEHVNVSVALPTILSSIPEEDADSFDFSGTPKQDSTQSRFGSSTFLARHILPTSWDYLSSGWPVAYLITTVIFGIGALVGAFTYVAQPSRVAHEANVSNPRSLAPNPRDVVGRITGMVDCQWAEGSRLKVQGSRPSQSLVSLGDQLSLASGLLEITYRTGAKVILQGPVTYTVEAADGGFLALGKLTARVEKASSSSRPLVSNRLFAVRTPTAVVTDMGTEFYVDVQQDGTTTAHVLTGAIEVRNDRYSERLLLTAEGTRTVRVDAKSRKSIVLPNALDIPIVSTMPRETRPKTLLDESFDEAKWSRVDGDLFGRYFTVRSLEFGDQGRAAPVVGNPPGIVTLDCQAGPRSGSIVELITRWQNCFPMLETSPVQLTFSIASGTGGLENDQGYPHRKWVGVTSFGVPRDIYHPLDTQGFYVTLAMDATYKDFGAKSQHHGNILSIDSSGNKSFLASWDWGTYDGNNALTIRMTLTSTTYNVALSDPNIMNLTGSLSGTLPSEMRGQTHVVAWCQGIEQSASLSIDRILVERLPPVAVPAPPANHPIKESMKPSLIQDDP